MSSERLRAELHRIAERAPQVRVDPEVFTRGRRAHARAQVLGVVVAVGCVALLAALVAPLLCDEPPPVTGTSTAAGIPDRLFAVPDGVRRHEPGDTGVRRGAVVVLDAEGRATLVDADDGSYHPLRLPGFFNDSAPAGHGYLTDPPVALSPDGTRLAWGWVDGDRGGLRIAELGSGRVREVPLATDDDAGLLVMTVTWSPDGRWLGWDGLRIDQWAVDGDLAEPSFAGALAAGEGRSSVVTVNESGWQGPTGVAVSDDGALAAVNGDVLVRGGAPRRLALPADAELTGLRFVGDRVVGVVAGLGDRRPVALVDLPSGRRIAALRGAMPTELGALDPRHLVHLVGVPGGQEVRIVDPRQPDAAVAVIEVPDGVRPASLALDLMTLDRPTVPRPAPDWPWWTGKERGLLVAAAIVAVALGALAWLLRGWRPRITTAPPPTRTRGRRGRPD